MPPMDRSIAVNSPSSSFISSSYPLFSPDRLEVQELKEIILDEAGAAQQQALDLLEVDVPYNCLLDGRRRDIIIIIIIINTTTAT